MLMRGQIWVETVLYTLLGLALMGLVLAFAVPKITSAQERALVEQSIQSMDTLYQAIETVQARGVGNVKVITFGLRAGTVILDGENDTIQLVLPDQKSAYSQPGSAIQRGAVSVQTDERSGTYRVTLFFALPTTNLTIAERDERKILTPVSTAYRITVSAIGTQPGKSVLSFETS